MSLVPYQPQEGREIVLRHRNAIVVYDLSSQRLEIRGVAECPTCHRPMRSSSPERPHFSGGDDGHHHGGSSHSSNLNTGGNSSHSPYSRHEGYVDPNYFRLLRAGHHVGQLRAAPPSPSSTSPGPGVNRPPITPRATGSPLRRLFQPLVGRADAAESDADSRQGTPVSMSGDSVSSVDYDDAGDAAYGAGLQQQYQTRPRTSSSGEVPYDAEFVSSTPYVAPDVNSSPINKGAFSPNYFRTFFVEERELGRGGKGVVLLVRHEIDGCQLGHFACKRVPVGDDHAWLEKVLVEVELLAKLSHPNLVSYRHVWLENVTLNRFGPRVACAFILQQYCNSGDLHHYILGDQPKEATKEELKAQMRRRSKGGGQTERPKDLFAPSAATSSPSPAPTPGSSSSSSPAGAASSSAPSSGPYRRLAFDEIYSLFKDITSGLAYLHAANYIHRDLKPSNCLLHREGRIITCLISDFGEVQAENVARKSTGTTGTISYCAPEVLRRDPKTKLFGNFTTKSDIFSLGMILYFMCFGRLPYRSSNAVHEELEDVDELRVEISDWKGFQYERRARTDLPSKLYQLLTQMLSANPAERPSANEVLLAMRTDSNNGFDGFQRSGSVSSGSGGVASSSSTSTPGSLAVPQITSGRRIQNLDSPDPSNTPVPGPKVNRHVGSPVSHVEDLDEMVIDDSDDPLSSSSPLLRPHRTLRSQKQRLSTSTSLTLTRSHGGSHSRSPDRGGSALNRRGGSLDSGRQETFSSQSQTAASSSQPHMLSPVRRPRRQHDEQSEEDDDGHETNALTPLVGSNGAGVAPTPTYLLMPPPTTFWGEVRHRGLIAQYHTSVFLHHHGESVEFLFRTALFFVKMASLTKPCWPYMVRFGVGAALMGMAALDLGIPRGAGGDRTAAAHYTTYAPPTRLSLWRWDWRVSVVLFALHFAILALATRSDVLCATHGSSAEEPVAWEDW